MTGDRRSSRSVRTACAALASCLLVATVPMTASAGARVAAQPEAPADVDVAASPGPIVHILNTRPEEDVGVVKLARYHGASTASAGNMTVVTTHYEDLCPEPCGVPVDISERPIFFLVRDGQPVSKAFRLPDTDEVTLKFKPPRRGVWGAGLVLTCLLIFPAGIPMMVVGQSKLFIADGAPATDQRFTRLEKAKL